VIIRDGKQTVKVEEVVVAVLADNKAKQRNENGF
jgi:hypothetical protein